MQTVPGKKLMRFWTVPVQMADELMGSKGFQRAPVQIARKVPEGSGVDG